VRFREVGFQYGLCDFDIFEGMGTIGTKNGFFMTLAENEDEIALLGFV
jgi:hypothetical protein